MKKYFIRLVVALITFSFGLFLTGLTFQTHKCGRSFSRRYQISKRAVLTVHGADEGLIRSLYAAYGPAQTRHDREFFEKFETEDFILFTENGTTDRTANINWMTAEPFGDVYERKLTALHVFGSTAVAHGVTTVKETNGSSDEWRFTDVLVKRAGVWKIRSTTQSF